MMERYVYLTLAVYYAAFWLAVFFRRRDLRPKLLMLSLAGAIGSLASEYWFRRDYWHPPVAVPIGVYSLDDALFGFFFTGIAAVAYDALFRRAPGAVVHKKGAALLGVAAACAVLFLIGTQAVHWNSAGTSLAAMLVFVTALWLTRPDLILPSAVSPVLLWACMLPAYAVLFGMLAPGWWQRYLFAGVPFHGLYAAGVMPLMEAAWSGALAMAVSIAYEGVLDKAVVDAD